MYWEIKEFLEKAEDLLHLSLFELNELENILFLTYSAGYEQGVEDSLVNEDTSRQY